MKVIAPGKLILSGEHAVVYGYPALAMAINRYVSTTIQFDEIQKVSLSLLEYSYQDSFHFFELLTFNEKIKKKYKKYLNREISIKDVLQHPEDLVKSIFNFPLDHGLKIRIESNIPIGSGLGSSAATILSVLYALYRNIEWAKLGVLTDSELFEKALEIENYQHGHSSGFDLKITKQGGILFTQNQRIYQRKIFNIPMYLVNTGKPQSTTGECVEVARNYFKTSNIGNDFESVTVDLDKAFQVDNFVEINAAIKENHKLLSTIGVVPKVIQNFITEIEKFGSAKICGAGAVKGDQCGAVLVITEDEIALQKLATHYRYSIIPIQCEQRGVHYV